MAGGNNTLRMVPTKVIRPNLAALRAVDRKNEKWKEFVDSIRSKGILNPLVGRDMVDRDTGASYVGLVDGLHRYTGALEVGLETVPMHVITATDAEALEAQIVTNIHSIETKGAQYAAALKRLLVMNDTLTMQELADKLGKSITWLSARLKINDLTESIKELVDDGKITITNAQALAGLPQDEQTDYVDRAITMTPGQFVPLVNDRVKDLKDAQKQGRKPGKKEFRPTAFLQLTSAIRDELDNMTIGKSLLHQYKITDPHDAWKMAIRWVLHLDDDSVEVQKQKHIEAARKKEEERLQRKREKEENAAQEAAKLAVATER